MQGSERDSSHKTHSLCSEREGEFGDTQKHMRKGPEATEGRSKCDSFSRHSVDLDAFLKATELLKV